MNVPGFTHPALDQYRDPAKRLVALAGKRRLHQALAANDPELRSAVRDAGDLAQAITRADATVQADDHTVLAELAASEAQKTGRLHEFDPHGRLLKMKGSESRPHEENELVDRFLMEHARKWSEPIAAIELLGELLERHLLPGTRGLRGHHAEQLLATATAFTNEHDTAAVLRGAVPLLRVLDDDGRNNFFLMMNGLTGAERSRALGSLGPAYEFLTPEHHKAILKEIDAKFPEADRAAIIFRRLFGGPDEDDRQRSEMLCGAARGFAALAQTNRRAVARQILAEGSPDESFAAAVAALGERLPLVQPDQRSEIVDRSLKLFDSGPKGRALAALLKAKPESFDPKKLEEIRTAADAVQDPVGRGHALAALSLDRPDHSVAAAEARQSLLDTDDDRTFSVGLEALGAHLSAQPKDFLPAALERTMQCETPEDLARATKALGSNAGAFTPEDRATFLDFSVRDLERLGLDEGALAHALSGTADGIGHFEDPLMVAEHLLEHADKFTDERNSGLILGHCARRQIHLPEEKIDEIVERILVLRTDSGKARAIALIAGAEDDSADAEKTLRQLAHARSALIGLREQRMPVVRSNAIGKFYRRMEVIIAKADRQNEADLRANLAEEGFSPSDIESKVNRSNELTKTIREEMVRFPAKEREKTDVVQRVTSKHDETMARLGEVLTKTHAEDTMRMAAFGMRVQFETEERMLNLIGHNAGVQSIGAAAFSQQLGEHVTENLSAVHQSVIGHQGELAEGQQRFAQEAYTMLQNRLFELRLDGAVNRQALEQRIDDGAAILGARQNADTERQLALMEGHARNQLALMVHSSIDKKDKSKSKFSARLKDIKNGEKVLINSAKLIGGVMKSITVGDNCSIM